MPDLTDAQSRDDVRTLVNQAFPGAPVMRVASFTGQLWALRRSIKPGDIVVMPMKTTKRLALGIVTSEYLFQTNEVDPDCRHSIGVDWRIKDLNRAVLKDDLMNTINGASTIFQASKNKAETRLRALLNGATSDPGAGAAPTNKLADSVEADHESLGVPAGRRGRGVASMVAHARRESPHRGQRHLGLAKVATTELPHTWAAWRAGRITEWRATLIARETGCLSLEHRLAVDAAVAGDPDKLEAMSDRQTIAAAQAEATRLDAAAQVARRRKAESERHVSIRPAPDTMVWLTALVPVADGVAAYAALTRAANSARSEGDPRSRGQVMADELVRRTADGVGDRDSGGAERPVHPVALNLVMSHDTLFGTSDEPGHLTSFGPIPAELARELVAGALAADHDLWLRRLYTHPTTGELVTMDSRARLFPSGLARFIRLRDQVCRTPWCDAPVRHVDHVEGHDDGGPTSAFNGQGLCEACNYSKQAPRWRSRPGPDGTVSTTTPTGHTHTSRPPPLARIHSHDPPLTIDFVLAS